MTAFITIADHPIRATVREQFELPPGTRLDAWLIDVAGVAPVQLMDQPPLAVFLNSEPLSLERWTIELQAGDRVLILPKQYGMELIIGAIIAVVFAVVATAMMPEIPEQGLGDLDQSPSYSADAQGNRARLGSPIPVIYGDVRFWPDFAALPYRRYHRHDQYLYQLFSLGQGEHEYSEIRIGETPLSSFSEAEYRFYAPGEPVTLFPVAVIESDEVRDIQLYAPDEEEYEDQPESPAYISSPAGTDAARLELDFVFPGGCYYMSDDGPVAASVSVYVHTRPVDDDDNPVGEWSLIADETFSGDSADVLRYTVDVAVTGRVEVKARRYTNTPDGDGYRQKTDVHWAGLRAYLNQSPVFDHPVMALKMRVDDQLSRQSERKINLRVQRKLPVWTASGWSEPVVTRSPVWALCDAVKARWGGKFGDDQLDLPELAVIAAELKSKGVNVDLILDRKGKLWSVLQQICSTALAEPVLAGGVFSMRCDVQEVPEYHFGMADMLPGSFSIEYVTVDEWGYDSVEIEYTDPVSWKPATVLCSVTDSVARPQTVKLPGCTSLEQARVVGHRIAARRAFRTRRVGWKSELNGRLPRYGDTVRVSNEYPQWGISGTVLSVYADGRTLELSEPVPGGGWLVIPGPAGTLQGPWQVSAGDDEYHVVLPAEHGADIRTTATHASEFASSFAYAEAAESIGLPVKVRSIRVIDDYTVELSGESDTPRVYDPPFYEPPQLGVGNGEAERSLAIAGLKAVQRGTLSEPELQLSWNPVAAARGYRVEYRYSGGDSWTAAGVAPGAHYILSVLPREVYVRVAVEVAEGVGPWSTITAVAGEELGAPPAPENLTLSEPFVGLDAKFKWAKVDLCTYIVEVISSDGVVCRSDAVGETAYIYTAEQARGDGVGRGFTLRVYSRSMFTGVVSVEAATLEVGNPAPPPLKGITVLAGADSIGVFFTPSSVPDLAGYVVYYGQSPVTTNSKRLIVEGQTGYIQIPVTDDRIYRIRIAAYDHWGLDGINLSPETADVAAGIREGQLAASLRRDIERIPELDNALAGIRRDVEVVDDKATAYAQQIATLQAGVAGDRQALATVQTLQKAQGGSIENLAAMWTTRAVAGSSQAYVGLRAGHGDPSRVILGADEVAIGDANAQHFPFVVIDGKVYLSDAMIGTATVGTLQLAGNAVTVPASLYIPQRAGFSALR